MNARLPFLAYFCKHDTAKYCLDTLVIGVDAQQCPPRQPTKNQVSLENARFHGHILRLEVGDKLPNLLSTIPRRQPNITRYFPSPFPFGPKKLTKCIST